MILLIDNYDSFVFNLARYLVELGCETDVVRNDTVTVEEITDINPAAIVLSPGPCTPAESGVCRDVVRQFGDHVPMLGVCLGHQVIADVLGGRVIRAREAVHGRTSEVLHDGMGLFEGLPHPLTATRYHSLVVENDSLPSSLRVTATLEDDTIMAVQHYQWPLFGVQFHPESVLTQGGHQLLANFLRLAGMNVTANETPRSRSCHEPVADFFQQPIDRSHPPATANPNRITTPDSV